MGKTFRNILINSTLAFVSAFIITTIIHEFGHYISYLIFGANPTLFHNYVQIPDQQLDLHVKIISALAGPVFSLIQGLIFSIIISKWKENSAKYLLILWLSLLGFVNFFGYLLMTPLSKVGDTGKAAELLNMSYVFRILIAVIGLAILIWVILKIGKYFSNFIPADLDLKQRSKYVYHIMFFPIMIGSLVNMLLAFPVVAILSVIYPLTSSYVIMSSFGSILKSKLSLQEATAIGNNIKLQLVFLALITIIINRLLTFGIG